MKTKNRFTLITIINLSFFALSWLSGALGLVSGVELKAQNIGINGTGGTAHPSALLDVDAVATPSLGILIPRIALQAINLASPVSSPATSLLVYNTASASTGTNAVSAGYYYWNGTKWVRFAYSPSGSSASDWNLLGNLGTTAGTHFLGTTDAQDLVFKTNNIEKMRILSNGQVGIGTIAPNTGSKVEIVGATKVPNSGTLIHNDPAVTGLPAIDGFRLKYDNNFFGTNLDALVFEKTDGNTAVPDGGIAFTNTGMSGTEVP